MHKKAGYIPYYKNMAEKKDKKIILHLLHGAFHCNHCVGNKSRVVFVSFFSTNLSYWDSICVFSSLPFCLIFKGAFLRVVIFYTLERITPSMNNIRHACKQTWYNATPYNAHSLFWLWKVYVVYDCRPQPTTSKQSTLWRLENAFSGILTRVNHCLPGLALLPVSPLGKLPKRLGPRVEVNQRGLRILRCTGLHYIMYAYRYLFAAPGPIWVQRYSHATSNQPYIFISAQRWGTEK